MKLSNEEFRAKAKALAKEVLETRVEQIGDIGMGGQCPFCGIWCPWDRTLEGIEHKSDCIVKVANEIVTDEDDECSIDGDGCLIDNDGDAETDMEERLREEE